MRRLLCVTMSVSKGYDRGLQGVPAPGFTAVYGGSFNPPHLGHQMACLYLLEALGAEEVWLVPAFDHPFGKKLASFEHRLAMCEAMVDVFAKGVCVKDAEKRANASGRTYDLLRHLKEKHPHQRLALVIGSDILAETHKWHRWEDIVQEFEVVLLGRQGYPHPEFPHLVDLPPISSSAVRDGVAQGATPHHTLPSAVSKYIQRHGLYRA